MKNNATIISNSWGFYTNSAVLNSTAYQLSGLGVIVVASAGNDGLNTDTSVHPPSSITAPCLLSVAAVDSTGALWSQSNRGVKTVSLAAPGVQIEGLGLGSLYVKLTGSSMSAPHVASLVALIKAANPQLTCNAVVAAIKDTAKALQGVANGLIQPYAAIQAAVTNHSIAAQTAISAFVNTESANSSLEASSNNAELTTSVNIEADGGATLALQQGTVIGTRSAPAFAPAPAPAPSNLLPHTPIGAVLPQPKGAPDYKPFT